jgi:hypothetical protein
MKKLDKPQQSLKKVTDVHINYETGDLESSYSQKSEVIEKYNGGGSNLSKFNKFKKK